MNRYRSYMDRIVPPAGLREKILVGDDTKGSFAPP